MENERVCVIPLHTPSVKEKVFFFMSGILVSIPFTLFFAQLYIYVPLSVSIVILAPLIEELAKVFPLFYRHGETERSTVILAILIGLGFGISELVLYVFFLGIPLIARVPGVLFHASSATITAYGIAKKFVLPYYLIAVMLHLGNNFFATANILTLSFFAELLILISTYFLALRFYNNTSKEKVVT